MHAAALHLIPVLAAEKNKTPFYIAAGILALWAVVISMAVGLRMSWFPSNLAGQRLVIVVTATLVGATLATAVITSGVPARAIASQPAAQAPASVPATPPPSSGGAPSPSRRSTSSTLQLAANPSGVLAFSAKALSARAGTLHIRFSNSSPLEHNLTIARGSQVLAATPTFKGGSHTLTVHLPPGTYTFYCSVPGHRQAGMEGTLRVS